MQGVFAHFISYLADSAGGSFRNEYNAWHHDGVNYWDMKAEPTGGKLPRSTEEARLRMPKADAEKATITVFAALLKALAK